MKRLLLAAAVMGALHWAPVAAQTVINQNLSGNEVVEYALGIGGGYGNTTVNALRNATGYQLVPTGTTVNTTVANTASKVLATGAITTWNIVLPVLPFDGQDVAIACPGGTATAAITATEPSGVTVVGTAFTACTSGGAAANGAEYIYSKSANVWYRIQ